jgi:hypothetical protein
VGTEEGAILGIGLGVAPFPLPVGFADKFGEADTGSASTLGIRTVAACPSRGTGFGEEYRNPLDIRKIENVYCDYHFNIWLV